MGDSVLKGFAALRKEVEEAKKDAKNSDSLARSIGAAIKKLEQLDAESNGVKKDLSKEVD